MNNEKVHDLGCGGDVFVTVGGSGLGCVCVCVGGRGCVSECVCVSVCVRV